MPIFIAVIKQSEGCDYTIGCGIRVTAPIYASNNAEAEEMLLGALPQLLGGDEGRSLKEIRLLEIVNQRWLDVENIRANFEKERRALAVKAKERVEREEYERLKSKFDP